MSKVVSIINLKGGVGKTTLTVALAEFLVEEFDCKVLVVDTDPQTNLTVSLIDEKDWKNRNAAGRTLCQLFKDKLDGTNIFDLKTALVKSVSNLHGGIKKLDLIPSSLDFIGIQDRLVNIGAGTFYTLSPTSVLKGEIGSISKNYDYVLIDCPPNLGIVTLNALNMSDYYLVPVIPDVLSTYGVPQIGERVAKFSSSIGRQIEPLGIVISLYREQVRLHRSVTSGLRADAASGKLPRIFETVVPNMGAAAGSVDFTSNPNTLRQKYGYGRSYDVYRAVVEEFLKYAK